MKDVGRFPPIPSRAFSLLGPVPVVREDLGPDDLGLCYQRDRLIKLHSEMPPASEWSTYWHEVMHLLLWDAGLNAELPKKVEERICDAVGTYMAAAVRAGFLKVEET